MLSQFVKKSIRQVSLQNKAFTAIRPIIKPNITLTNIRHFSTNNNDNLPKFAPLTSWNQTNDLIIKMEDNLKKLKVMADHNYVNTSKTTKVIDYIKFMLINIVEQFITSLFVLVIIVLMFKYGGEFNITFGKPPINETNDADIKLVEKLD